jgi:transcriptional regulator with PAS, ATPase and Fis domain
MKQPGKKISETFGLFGESACMRKIFQCIKKATTTPATVLLSGESGTGKELVARAIHYNSKRASAPFVPVNCGSIPEGLLESELFGYVKGAFTGAHESRAGFFQTADGGTIFLDEIGETSIAMQIKLLRVLQEKEVYMVGDSKPKKVDIRIIAATNKDLKKLIEKGSFREELYFRINVITIDIPPLRERGNDILLLAHQFLTKFSTELGKPMPQLTDNSRRALLNYDWPGNVRELENVMQRVVVMSEDTVIDVPDLPAIMRFSVQQDRGTHRTLAEMEREHIGYVLRSVDGNKTRAAQILGVDRKTLRERIKQYQLPAG